MKTSMIYQCLNLIIVTEDIVEIFVLYSILQVRVFTSKGPGPFSDTVQSKTSGTI